MAERPTAIRTPDQRIRVFVSSTLRELEPERRAVRAAVEQLRLAPVMFELGARPHPPRELYRSYLAQSDIFIGIYGEKYGWVAPGEDVSGLEDEYLLSGSLPRLIYVKAPAPEREERLAGLLARIRDDDRSSYKSFSTPDELSALVEADLAILLAERFDESRRVAEAPAVERAVDIPAPYNPIVGRERERRELADLLSRPDVRIVSIVGPGGIGKSRLAIEVAIDAMKAGRDVAFAMLESITTPDRVILAIARALGVTGAAGEGPLEDKVVRAIGDGDLVLVVDNMEHVIDAAGLLVRIVTECPRVQLLVTSRSPLRVRAERVYDLGPLDLPSETGEADAAARASAVELFVARAAAVRPGFALTPENSAVVVAICRALEGVPLAIELAAARVRSLSPADIHARLEDAFALLVSGARDLPERQRALRNTIAWSVDLLSPEARGALATLSVFAGTFALASAESVLAAVGVDGPLAQLEALVDASLVGRVDGEDQPTFRLLSLVRAYASTLGDPASRELATLAWIAHYRATAREASAALRGRDQLEWLAHLDREAENYAAVARMLIDRRELDRAAEYMWSLYLYLWIGGYLGLVEDWATEMLELIDETDAPASVRTRAIALYYRNAVLFWQDPSFDTGPGMRECRALFRETGDRFGAALAGISLGLALLARHGSPDFEAAAEALRESQAEFGAAEDTWGEAMADVMLARVDMLTGNPAGALAYTEESLTLAERQGERLGIVIALNHRGWTKLLGGDVEAARDDFSRSLDLSLALGHDESITYGLEAFAGIRAVEGDAAGAGRLVGAAQTLRRRKGFLNPGMFEFYMIPFNALREAGRGDEIDRGIAEGVALSVSEALELIRG